jgi:hypothetical protein
MAIVTNWKSSVVLSGCLLTALFSCPGCASDDSATTRPSMDAKADNAVRDPWAYSPFGGKPDMGNNGDHLVHTTLQQDLNDFTHP